MRPQIDEQPNRSARVHPAAFERCNVEVVASLKVSRLPQALYRSSSSNRAARCRATVGDVAAALWRRRGRPLRITVVLCPGLLALAGCAGWGQKFQDFQNGWRTAQVVEVGRADQIERRGYTDCRRSSDAAQLEGSRYAALTYRLDQRQHWHIVKVGPDVSIAAGDMVVANVESCELPIYPLSSVPAGPR